MTPTALKYGTGLIDSKDHKPKLLLFIWCDSCHRRQSSWICHSVCTRPITGVVLKPGVRFLFTSQKLLDMAYKAQHVDESLRQVLLQC